MTTKSLHKKTIIITSNEPWGDIWYSKQNYAYELSKKYKVIFLNPPTNWRIQNIFTRKFEELKYSESLSYVDYQNNLPLLNNCFNRINNFIVSKRLKNYLKKIKVEDYIIWAFDPIRLYNPKLLGAELGIYHCVDEFYFRYLGETELCKNSDVIFSTSWQLLDAYEKFNTPKFLVPHGISSEEFVIDTKVEKKIDIPVKNYALYIGVINNRLDFELLEKALIKFSEVPFLFVGPVMLQESSDFANRIFIERKYPNLFTVGIQHFKKLKYYVKNARFCISFMDEKYPGNRIGHHKTLVYLTQGKPVFGPTFSDYKDLKEIMYMDDTHAGLLSLIESFISNGENEILRDKRIKYAKELTFENILSRTDIIIEQLLESKRNKN